MNVHPQHASPVPTQRSAAALWRLIGAFALAQGVVFTILTGPLWGQPWSEGFRNYFANDQLSYAAIATNVANGGSPFVEPFTQTGTSTYPSGWYLVLGLASSALDQPVWVVWQALGVLAIMAGVAVVGWAAWRISGRAWAPLLPALALLTGTLAVRTSGDWLTVLGYHAVIWGPFGTLFTLNAEAVGVVAAAAALAVLVVAATRTGMTLRWRATLTVLAAAVVGLVANVQTYTFLTATALGALIAAITSVLMHRAWWLAALSAALLVLVLILGSAIADTIGPLPLFVLVVATAAPAAWPLLRRHPPIAMAALIAFAVCASPQVIRTLLGLAADDPFLRYRQESTQDLGVPTGPLLIAILPLLGIGIACAVMVWRRGAPALAAVLIALPLAVAILVTNDRWGFNQEPYRFLLQLGIVGALLLSVVAAWAIAQWRTSSAPRRTAFAVTGVIAIVVWAIGAWDATAWWAYARTQGVINVTDARSGQLRALLEGREGLVMSSQCLDPRVLKLVHRGQVAFYNAGLAWPADEQAFKIFQDAGRRAGEDDVALDAANVTWVVTDAQCPTDWNFARGVPIMQVAEQGPWRLWRVE